MLSTQTGMNSSTFMKDELSVKIMPSRNEMGRVAANDVINKIKELLAEKEELNIIFAAAPSQNEFIHHLILASDIDWSRINAFHMDEYIGLDKNAPQGFGNFLKERLFDKVPFKTVNYINGQAGDIDKECERYSCLLKNNPVDIVCLGIGENGHIAFNDPDLADFNDNELVKSVELELISRQQQVNEACFSHLDEVPLKAITLTIPALLQSKYMFCVVPAYNKAKAVYKTLNGQISEECPATILRTKENAILYLDKDSAMLLDRRK